MTFPLARGVRNVLQMCVATRRLGQCHTRPLATQIDSITESLFSETQLSVRRSVQKLCEQFPDTYWAEADRTATYPIEFRKAITKRDGWELFCRRSMAVLDSGFLRRR